MLLTKLEESLIQRKNNFEFRDHSVQGKNYLSFATNDYLGLANHPAVVSACENALKKYGVGSSSAYLIAGYTKAHQELEEALANFLGFKATLVFSCGYMANLGVVSSLFSKHDVIFADKLSHASLIDGAIASKANFKRYPHCDVNSLNNLCELDQQSNGNKLIITEGVFGMDGTVAPLKEISAISKRNNAMLLVDDTHGIGILGHEGQGSLKACNLESNCADILTSSFGKAFGTYGAFVASSHVIIESLKQFARTYLYTTAIPPAIASATLASLNIIQTENWRRQKLLELVQYFRLCANQLGIPLTSSQTAIQPIILGSSEKALRVSQYLQERGLVVKAIRPPTVPFASARIRISLTVQHQKHHIDYLMENLVHAINSA
jgi:8-amino-7-oxononanoate synthase